MAKTKAVRDQYAALRTRISEWLSPRELKKIDEAFAFAERVHAGERRASGESYLRHPVEVANILASIRPDAATVMAAILHDTLEEKPYDVRHIKRAFGDEVATLVEGVTKLDRIQLNETSSWFSIPLLHRRTKERLGHERHVESLRKMLLAMTKDIRVILIKLADRLDNMRTLAPLRPDKRRRIAQDTLELYAPIANRLGMGEWRGELQDLAFPYVYPQEHAALQERVARFLPRYEVAVNQAKQILADEFAKVGIKAEIHGRVKHLYSLWLKLQRYDNDLERIYDLIALRVIVNDDTACYHALGIVHKLWKPLFGRIKDYISLPKPNGYQSLHTTVFGPSGHILEVQIRSRPMHAWSDQGIAAHWLYSGAKEQGSDKRRSVVVSRNELGWLDEIRKWQQSLSNVTDLKATLKTDFFSDRIFCFTPAGDIVDLPAGSTPIDFAYQIHTTVGDRCIGATADNKNISLTAALKNGQIVEIRTSDKQHPRRDWLSVVKTEKARSRIRTHFTNGH